MQFRTLLLSFCLFLGLGAMDDHPSAYVKSFLGELSRAWQTESEDNKHLMMSNWLHLGDRDLALLAGEVGHSVEHVRSVNRYTYLWCLVHKVMRVEDGHLIMPTRLQRKTDGTCLELIYQIDGTFVESRPAHVSSIECVFPVVDGDPSLKHIYWAAAESVFAHLYDGGHLDRLPEEWRAQSVFMKVIEEAKARLAQDNTHNFRCWHFDSRACAWHWGMAVPLMCEGVVMCFLMFGFIRDTYEPVTVLTNEMLLQQIISQGDQEMAVRYQQFIAVGAHDEWERGEVETQRLRIMHAKDMEAEVAAGGGDAVVVSGGRAEKNRIQRARAAREAAAEAREAANAARDEAEAKLLDDIRNALTEFNATGDRGKRIRICVLLADVKKQGDEWFLECWKERAAICALEANARYVIITQSPVYRLYCSVLGSAQLFCNTYVLSAFQERLPEHASRKQAECQAMIRAFEDKKSEVAITTPFETYTFEKLSDFSSKEELHKTYLLRGGRFQVNTLYSMAIFQKYLAVLEYLRVHMTSVGAGMLMDMESLRRLRSIVMTTYAGLVTATDNFCDGCEDTSAEARAVGILKGTT